LSIRASYLKVVAGKRGKRERENKIGSHGLVGPILANWAHSGEWDGAAHETKVIQKMGVHTCTHANVNNHSSLSLLQQHHLFIYY